MLIIKRFKTPHNYLANHLGKSSIVITAVLIINFNGQLVLAEAIQPSQLPLDRILQQKNLESQQKQLFKKPVANQLIDKKPEVAVTPDQNCIVIEKVVFSGVTKLSKSKLNKLSQEITGNTTNNKNINSNCLNPSQIEAFLNKITNLYIDAGYTTSRAYFEKYLFQTKTLYLQISEGKIKNLKLNNIKKNQEAKPEQSSFLKPLNSFSNKAALFLAVPTKSERILKISDLEQGLAQINRLRSNNATMSIIAADLPGQSDIIIDNYQRDNHFETGISYDNNGSKATGVDNVTYNLNQDNLLLLNDNLNYSKIRSQGKNQAGSDTDMFNISLPLGYYSFNYSYNDNRYNTTTDNDIKISGTSSNHNFTLSRLILRLRNQELNLNTDLNFRNSTRKEAGLLTMPSQKLSTARIGFDYSLRTSDFGLAMSVTYSRGLTINGAIDDDHDFKYPLPKDAPKAQFNKIAYNLNLYKPFKYLTYNLTANGQLSNNALYGPELIYVGGSRYSVRGLQYNGISGAEGGYLRNDLALNLKEVLPSNILTSSKTNQPILNQALQSVYNLKPYIFYDQGYSKQIVTTDQKAKNEYIAGAGFGLKYLGKYLNGEISYAKTLNAPSYIIKANNNEKDAVYFGISGRYWLF